MYGFAQYSVASMEVTMEETRTILTFEHVTGRRGRFRLKDINLKLQAGYIYGLAGRNGAGKTTLMKYILEEHCRYKGEIYLDGGNISSDRARTMNKVGYIAEDNLFFEERTGVQNAEILGGLYDDFSMEKFREVMKTMEITGTKAYKRMSRGERLKFQLAFAIAHSPCLYLLDEATAGMDPVFRLELFDMLRHLIKDGQCAVLMTSHIRSEIEEKTDYVAVMEDGALGTFVESLDFAKIVEQEDTQGHI